MMDTILNLGLNDETVRGLIALTGNPRFAYDSYRRFVAMYGDVVLGLKPENKDEIDPFEELLERKKQARGVTLDTELTADDLRELVAEFKAAIRERRGMDFPEDPHAQLWGAIGAVFGSWNNDRAIVYRKLNGIPESWGTAVNVQAMVFGNMGDDSGTGVAFTRDPATGENIFYGEYLMNAQGEDVVAGMRTPLPIRRARAQQPQGLRPAARHPPHPRAPLPRHDGHRVHHRAGRALHAAVPRRKAHRRRRHPHRRRHGAREADHAGRKRCCASSPSSSTSCCARRSRRPRRRAPSRNTGCLAKGLNAGPGAATGRIVLQRRGRRSRRGARRDGDPGAHRDLAGGHPRHGRRRRASSPRAAA